MSGAECPSHFIVRGNVAVVVILVAAAGVVAAAAALVGTYRSSSIDTAAAVWSVRTSGTDASRLAPE